jgi:SAM-dependent methyltransferase
MNDQKNLWNKAHSEGDITQHSTTPTDFALSVLPLIKPHAKILELGCGSGNDSLAFANAGHEVLATDFADIAIEQNKKRFEGVANVTFSVFDMSQPFQLEPNTFDIIYARLSLHYFPDTVTKRIFEDIHKVLAPNGLLFFMCKSTNDALYGKGEKIAEDMFENNGHIRHFFSKEYALKCLGDKFKTLKLEERTDLLYGKNSSFIEVIAQKL